MSSSSVLITNPVVMKLEPEWFQSGYYVYAVVVKYEGTNYYYIGMTGDRKHLVARSPFYRMSGHFIVGNSTQNQIIRGIEKKFNLSVEDADEILCKMNFTYYSWLVKPFKRSTDETLHRTNREIAEKIESGLIVKCVGAFKERVFNKNLSRKDYAGYEQEVEQIFGQLQKINNE